MDFALEQTSVIINGHTFTGWSDDADALSLPDIELANVVRGADGGMVAVSTGNKGGPVVLKFLANSPSAKFMLNAAAAQLAGAGVKWNGIIRDSINQIVITLTNGTLVLTPSGPNLGKGEVKNPEFTIEFQKIIPVYLAATF